MNDFVDEIYKTIDAMIQRYVSKMKISQQENGVVIGESKKGSHRYMVKVKEAIYDVKDGIGLSPAPNTSVWVTVPNGDWNLAYICAGRNAETGYVTEEELKSTRAALEEDIQDVYDACVSGGAVINPTNLEKVIKAGTNITFTENANTLTINASSSITDVTLDGTSVVSEGVAILESGDFGKIKDVTVNGSSVVDQTGTAAITIPPSPTIPVTDVKVDNVSVLDGTVAKLSKNDLNIIKDVKVNGGTVVNPAGIANISVTNVVANPSGTASTDLTKLQVGNNIYNVSQGGGGSTVVPNPVGEPSTRLIKIGIDGTVYAVSAGEGGENYELFNYTGGMQTFTAPHTGDFKLEVWGAQGGSGSNDVHGGYGGYSVGTIHLTQGDIIYICVGGKGGGNATGDTSVVGYNGGGEANYGGNRGNGGGATHMALVTGTLNTLNNSLSDILIVAGGGGGAGFYSGSDSGDGGSGGGYIGGHGLFDGSVIGDSNSHTGSGGTQSTGGETEDYSIQSTGSFGQGANRDDGDLWGGSGGGGGLYGGGASTNNAGAGGGSGYLSSNLSDACMYGYNVSESAAIATRTVSVLSCSETPVEQVAKEGNGYAKISWQEDYDPYVTVGDLYNACIANNITPASHDLNDIVACFLS